LGEPASEPHDPVVTALTLPVVVDIWGRTTGDSVLPVGVRCEMVCDCATGIDGVTGLAEGRTRSGVELHTTGG
jgi:hypothetical protein